MAAGATREVDAACCFADCADGNAEDMIIVLWPLLCGPDVEALDAMDAFFCPDVEVLDAFFCPDVEAPDIFVCPDVEALDVFPLANI